MHMSAMFWGGVTLLLETAGGSAKASQAATAHLSYRLLDSSRSSSSPASSLLTLLSSATEPVRLLRCAAWRARSAAWPASARTQHSAGHVSTSESATAPSLVDNTVLKLQPTDCAKNQLCKSTCGTAQARQQTQLQLWPCAHSQLHFQHTPAPATGLGIMCTRNLMTDVCQYKSSPSRLVVMSSPPTAGPCRVWSAPPANSRLAAAVMAALFLRKSDMLKRLSVIAGLAFCSSCSSTSGLMSGSGGLRGGMPGLSSTCLLGVLTSAPACRRTWC
jgi:hypothetical protein